VGGARPAARHGRAAVRRLDDRDRRAQHATFAPASPTSSIRSRAGSTASIVDIRSPDEYTGKIFAPEGVKELSVRAGHVPGAVNFPWGKAVNEDGTFKSADELKAPSPKSASTAPRPIITYCRIGERSSHTWFALSRILGYDVRNYDGSWTEYGNSVGVPVTNLAGTVWTGK
jgi:thiosulfate/3-mercaptopyruvate sulfurtransferase